MGGLNIGLGGGVKIGGISSAGATYPAPVQQTTYGAESSPSSSVAGGGISAHHFQVGIAVAGVLVLACLRWSLPKGGKA